MKKLHYAIFLMFGLTISLAGISTGLALSVGAQQKPAATPSPTPKPIKEEEGVVRVDTELVNINVRVVDRFTRPINGLKQSDFTILEDGVPQRIEFFSQSEVPTNYSLVVDNSGSLRRQIEKVIEASKILVGFNKPQDETMVIRFVSRDKIEIRQEFTSKKEYVNDALDNFNIEGGQTAVRDAVYLAAQHVTDYEKTGKDDRKRRAIILITDGEDRDSFYTEAQLYQMLREADVQIYVIGFVEDLDKDTGFIRKSEQSRSKSFLEKLANETGGKAYFPTGNEQLNSIAKEIAGEMRTQYSIGYMPSNDREDGTFRQIRVTVPDGPGGQKRIPLTKAGRTAGAVADPSKPAAKP